MAMLCGSLPARATEPAFDGVEAIKTASTPAQHEAIATRYTEQMRQLGKQISRHKKMREAYGAITRVHRHLHRDQGHCDTLITAYRRAQEASRRVAARHRVKAEAAKRWVHRGACGFNACGTAATIHGLPSRP
jgi:hypothetical protein